MRWTTRMATASGGWAAAAGSVCSQFSTMVWTREAEELVVLLAGWMDRQGCCGLLPAAAALAARALGPRYGRAAPAVGGGALIAMLTAMRVLRPHLSLALTVGRPSPGSASPPLPSRHESPIRRRCRPRAGSRILPESSGLSLLTPPPLALLGRNSPQSAKRSSSTPTPLCRGLSVRRACPNQLWARQVCRRSSRTLSACLQLPMHRPRFRLFRGAPAGGRQCSRPRPLQARHVDVGSNRHQTKWQSRIRQS